MQLLRFLYFLKRYKTWVINLQWGRFHFPFIPDELIEPLNPDGCRHWGRNTALQEMELLLISCSTWCLGTEEPNSLWWLGRADCRCHLIWLQLLLYYWAGCPEYDNKKCNVMFLCSVSSSDHFKRKSLCKTILCASDFCVQNSVFALYIHNWTRVESQISWTVTIPGFGFGRDVWIASF